MSDTPAVTDSMIQSVILGASPLHFEFPLSGSVTVTTDVFGDQRNNAVVSIKNGSLTVWAATLTQVSPVGTIQSELILGSINIKAGTTFTLTIPTSMQNGNVMMNGSIQSPPSPDWVQINAQVASWPLNSNS